MATKVFMEALSPTMEEGRLISWLKKEGDEVAEGEDAFVRHPFEEGSEADYRFSTGDTTRIRLPDGREAYRVRVCSAAPDSLTNL